MLGARRMPMHSRINALAVAVAAAAATAAGMLRPPHHACGAAPSQQTAAAQTWPCWRTGRRRPCVACRHAAGCQFMLVLACLLPLPARLPEPRAQDGPPCMLLHACIDAYAASPRLSIPLRCAGESTAHACMRACARVCACRALHARAPSRLRSLRARMHASPPLLISASL